ncbi:MAG: NAD(+)/NADH kinase [Bacteroidetes bacterium]|nr:NAD(+)/NADH kinase [Bacteroidota bacterium]
MQKKIAFVVNKGSGPNRNIDHEHFIEEEVGTGAIIIYWQSVEQVREDVNRLVEQGIDIIVAIGGDGAVSYIAGLIANKDVTLCIIPIGSGNGLARHLSIPLKISNALSLLSTGKTISIDSVNINGRKFFCTAGVGFDAHLGNIFANSRKRGFVTYVKLAITEFFNFKCRNYKIRIDDVDVRVEAFLISFCNATQYGNDVHIAPQADISDGEVDIVVLKPFNFFKSVYLFYLLKNGRIGESKYIQSYKGKAGVISIEGQENVHFDGEVERMGPDLSFEVDPGSLKVLVPK